MYFVWPARRPKLTSNAAIQEIYKVKVQDVNIINVPGKRKRVRMNHGYTSDWKKAIATLKEGNKIEVA